MMMVKKTFRRNRLFTSHKILVVKIVKCRDEKKKKKETKYATLSDVCL